MRRGVGAVVDLLESLRAHKRHIDSHIKGHKAFVGTDVGRGFLTADVLLAGLKGQTEAAAALSVTGLTDNPSGELADIFLPAGHEAHVRAAETHRDAEALAVTDSDVSAPLRRSLQHRESGRVAIFNEYSAFLVDGLSEAGQVLDDSVAVDRRSDESGHIVPGQLGLHAVKAGLAVLARDERELGAVVVRICLDRLDDIRKQG